MQFIDRVIVDKFFNIYKTLDIVLFFEFIVRKSSQKTFGISQNDIIH